MARPVELNPEQASVMLDAFWAERKRSRHEAEPWPSQAERDVVNRDKLITQAINLGVPVSQVRRFVFNTEVLTEYEQRSTRSI